MWYAGPACHTFFLRVAATRSVTPLGDMCEVCVMCVTLLVERACKLRVSIDQSTHESVRVLSSSEVEFWVSLSPPWLNNMATTITNASQQDLSASAIMHCMERV